MLDYQGQDVHVRDHKKRKNTRTVSGGTPPYYSKGVKDGQLNQFQCCISPKVLIHYTNKNILNHTKIPFIFSFAVPFIAAQLMTTGLSL